MLYTISRENESIHPKRLVKEVQIENLSLRMTREYIQKHRSSPINLVHPLNQNPSHVFDEGVLKLVLIFVVCCNRLSIFS